MEFYATCASVSVQRRLIRTPCIFLKFFFCFAPSFLEFASQFLTISGSLDPDPSLFSAGRTTVLCLNSPLLLHRLPSGMCLLAESRGDWGAHFVFLLSQFTVLCDLLSSIQKRLFHIFCPICWLLFIRLKGKLVSLSLSWLEEKDFCRL